MLAKLRVLILFATIACVSLSVNNELEDRITFTSRENNLIFETKYKSNLNYLEVTEDSKMFVYSIYNLDDELVESWSFPKEKYENRTPTDNIGNTSVVRYYNTKSIGSFKENISHGVVLEVYSNGSFGQYNECLWDMTYIDGWSEFKISKTVSSVKPADGKEWPTSKVQVDYSVEIETSYKTDGTTSRENLLLNEGFESLGNNKYSKNIDHSYYIQIRPE